jgi:hypothetical protein
MIMVMIVPLVKTTTMKIIKYKPALLILMTSCYTYAEKKQIAELYHKAKSAVATTSLCLGTYLLYDMIKTAIDLQKIEQQNSEKVIALNSAIAAGCIALGAYLTQQCMTRDESEKGK